VTPVEPIDDVEQVEQSSEISVDPEPGKQFFKNSEF
jgi:hypothetical protein